MLLKKIIADYCRDKEYNEMLLLRNIVLYLPYFIFLFMI